MMNRVVIAIFVATFAFVAAAHGPWTAEPIYKVPKFDCPALATPVPAISAKSLRPGNIAIVAALGDSITAGFGMKTPNVVEDFLEYREAVFDIGGGKNETTITNNLKHYNPFIFGESMGITLPLARGQALNAAVSAARVENVQEQVDYLEYKMKESHLINFENDWKLLTLFIGANNVCPSCKDEYYAKPDFFEANYREILTKIHDQIPRVFVNVVTLFNVSQVWNVAHPDKYCATVEFIIPECDCLATEAHRKVMDDTAVEFNRRIYKVVTDLQTQYASDNGFNVVIQPGLEDLWMPDFPENPRPYLSNLDCFHPSVWANQGFALALWNNMWTPAAQKKRTIDVTNMHWICPTASSVLQ